MLRVWDISERFRTNILVRAEGVCQKSHTVPAFVLSLIVLLSLTPFMFMYEPYSCAHFTCAKSSRMLLLLSNHTRSSTAAGVGRFADGTEIRGAAGERGGAALMA
jgi:hypothetical protein